MASAAIGRAGIDLMTVVDATADRVALNYLDTHVGDGGNGVLSDDSLGRG